MPTMMSPLSLRNARPFAVAALLALFGFAGSAPVRADETASPTAEEMVLVSAKTVQSLEQRVIFLEETVAALTESWQHIDTHRMCAVDEDNGSETCLTKSRLDALLLHDAHDNHAAIVNIAPQESAKAAEAEDNAEASAPAPAKSEQSDASVPEKSASEISLPAPAKSEQSDASVPEKSASEISLAETPAAETPASDPSESPAAVVSENSSPATDPETTGSVQQAITGAAVLSFPHVETYEEPVARSED